VRLTAILRISILFSVQTASLCTQGPKLHILERKPQDECIEGFIETRLRHVEAV